MRETGRVDHRINALGYLCISTTLFAVWLVVVLFADRLTYVTFSRGQFRVHTAVGAGESTTPSSVSKLTEGL